MANKLLAIFSRTDAKSRIVIVIGTVVGIVGLVYLASHFLGGGGTTGSANVANAPSNLQSVPGGQLTPEYSRALSQENAQAAQRAQSTGTSAVATLVNVDEPAPASTTGANCTVVCPGGDNADVTNDITNLVKSGKLSQADANTLLDMAKNNVPVSQYTEKLAELVKQGKLTPEQARKLLEEYTNQHANALVASSAQSMDALIKSGKVPLEVGAELLALQKKGVSQADYANELNQLVAEGKISPETAATLLAQYSQQKNQQAAADNIAALQDMVKSGQITADTAADLTKLQQQNVPVSQYKAELDRLVAEGKITPATAAKLLALYGQQRTASGPGETLKAMAADADPDGATESDVNDLLSSGKISADTAKTLQGLQASHVSAQEYRKQLDALVKAGKISAADADKLMADYQKTDAANLGDLVAQGKMTADTANLIAAAQKNASSPAEYQKALDELVKEGKITPDTEKLLMARYASHQGKRQEIQKLMSMQANNVSPAEYTAELRRAVQAGLITPEEAARLQQEYTAMTAQVSIPASTGTAAGIDTNLPGDQSYARLQQRLANQNKNPQQQPQYIQGAPVDNSQQFADAAAQAAAQAAAAAEQARQQRIQGLVSAMSGQAHSLITAWQAPNMAHKGNSAPVSEEDEKSSSGKSTKTGSGLFGSSSSGSTAAPIIKAGTIFFATLDTAVNSDFPDTPIMATIVDGPYKGATLLGKIAISANTTTQSQDRVSLTFNTMNTDSWLSSQAITAFAIDPQTARTVMASNVDYHYAKRYGAMLGSAFLTGYASAISNAGATTSTGIFGTTTTHPELSPASKLAVGLGQVGTTLGTATANYINTPPTVKVNSGVGLGILFMSDVTLQMPGTGTGTTTTTTTTPPPVVPAITAPAATTTTTTTASK
jgi:intracellular multiplication protein IcmE